VEKSKVIKRAIREPLPKPPKVEQEKQPVNKQYVSGGQKEKELERAIETIAGVQHQARWLKGFGRRFL